MGKSTTSKANRELATAKPRAQSRGPIRPGRCLPSRTIHQARAAATPATDSPTYQGSTKSDRIWRSCWKKSQTIAKTIAEAKDRVTEGKARVPALSKKLVPDRGSGSRVWVSRWPAGESFIKLATFLNVPRCSVPGLYTKRPADIIGAQC